MRYSPLRGYPLVEFIQTERKEDLPRIIQKHVPEQYWKRVRLWVSSEKGRDRYWIQFRPAVRINCDTLSALAFVKSGNHFQSADKLMLDESATRIYSTTLSSDPCLLWLEAGELQVIAKDTLKALSFSAIIAPIKATELPIWKSSTTQQTRENHRVKSTREVLSIEAAQAQKDLLEELTRKLEGNQRRDRPIRTPIHRIVQRIIQRLLNILSRNSRPTRLRTRAHSSNIFVSTLILLVSAITWPIVALIEQFGNAFTPRTAQRTTRSESSLKRRYEQLMMRLQLNTMLGKQQTDYIYEMMRCFERKQYSEALSMAIALPDYRKLINSTPFFESMITALRYGRLSIVRILGGSNYSYRLAQKSYTQLKALYDEAYEQLDQDQQYRAAAFVLIALLNWPERGIDYLEKHNLVKEAAEIAEGQLAHRLERAVQLWMKAGYPDRAISLALRCDRVPTALTLIKGTPYFSQLESLWIEQLIANSDFETLFFHHLKKTDATANQQLAHLAHFFQSILPLSNRLEPVWLARYCAFMPWAAIAPTLRAIFDNPYGAEFSLFFDELYAVASIIFHEETSFSRSKWHSDLKQRVPQTLIKEGYRQMLTYQGNAIAPKKQVIDLIRSLITDRLFSHHYPKASGNPFVKVSARSHIT